MVRNDGQIWDDYWSIFDVVCESLINRNKSNIVTELRDTQLYINGLTDGWYEFYNRLTSIINSNIEVFNEIEKNDLFDLRNCLSRVLKKNN